MYQNKELELYTIKKSLDNQTKTLLDNKYVIPIYQRNFAWSEEQIGQLIIDISDYATENKDKNYYIGTLIVNRRDNNSLEIIDGQQRLTTLSILLSLIKNEYLKNEIVELKLNLTFDSRKNSTETLQALYNENDIEKYISENHNSITEGYMICKKVLAEVLNEKFKDNKSQFFDYLFEKVTILQVPVLEDTDLNHYFEIMNSRGEQLEKHEILKARLLDKLDENYRFIFNLIWEACSNMGRYIQFGFESKLRNDIFGDDLNSVSKNEDEIYNKIKGDNTINKPISILDILKDREMLNDEKNKALKINKEDYEEQERFNSIINFPNFLLHVLKIQVADKGEDIPLDDKRLLDTFNNFLNNKNINVKEFVKSFGYNLLKIKFLFDKYIIKRELKSNNWSLKQLSFKDSSYYKDSFSKKDGSTKNDVDDEDEYTGINKKILMLLSMFHVSYPQQAYKNWLHEVLKYLYDKINNEKNINAEDYKNKLKELAKKSYDKIIENDKDILDKLGTSVPHFIFNYLDYLLWEDDRYKNLNINIDNNISKKINEFKFTFRSSVEHYYPQHPKSIKYLDEVTLDNFGNLCLISGGENSKLSNVSPDEKKKYIQQNNKDISSIKQAIMMSYDKWEKEEIEKHGKEMIELLENTND